MSLSLQRTGALFERQTVRSSVKSPSNCVPSSPLKTTQVTRRSALLVRADAAQGLTSGDRVEIDTRKFREYFNTVISDKKNSVKRRSCCYCGDMAETAEDGCNLDCSCSWELAAAIWESHEGILEEEKKASADEFFIAAIESEPENELILAHYAIYLWKERGNLKSAEDLLEKSLEMEPRSFEARTQVLRLYSLFLSSTPPLTSKVLTDYRLSYSRHM